MLILKRKDAIKQGLVNYFTGKPCPKGHISERECSTRHCRACEKDRSFNNYHKNKKYYNDKSKEGYKNNREKRLEKSIKYQNENREYYRNKSKEHYYKNKEKYLNRYYIRQRLKFKPIWVLNYLDELVEIYKKCKLISKELSTQHHVDHIVPLKGENVCGLHVPWNLQIITAKENMSKGNSMPDDK